MTHQGQHDRNEVLKDINEVFAKYGLPMWSEANLGDLSRGECEVVALREVVPQGASRVQLVLEFRTPGGGGAYTATVGFGGRLIYVIPLVSVVEGEGAGTPRVCLCKRWRVELGRWTYQVPHGLEEAGAQDPQQGLDAFSSPAHRVLMRTFGQEFVDSLSAARVTPAGNFIVKGENPTATSYIVAASVLASHRRKKGDGAPVQLSWHDVLKLIDEGLVITDLASVAVLLRAARRFGIG